MKDLTCPLHGTSLIKQALRRHRTPCRAGRRGLLKPRADSEAGERIKTTLFHPYIRKKEIERRIERGMSGMSEK